MIRIGVFARISQAPVSTLRYYDQIGLLEAAYTDTHTGYRYYTLDQLPRLRRILALKEMGLSLDEIRRLLEEDLTLVELRGMLRLKQGELRQRVQEATERLARLEHWLRQIEQEEAMPTYEVVVKTVGPMQVLSIRDVVPDYPDQAALWDELDDFIGRQKIPVRPPGVTVYHREEPEIEVEVCLQVADGDRAREPSDGGRVRYHELPGIEAAVSTIHSGPLNAIGEGYQAVVQWVERQEYRISGPVREVYLRGPQAHSQTDPGVMVEIQAPVEKR